MNIGKLTNLFDKQNNTCSSLGRFKRAFVKSAQSCPSKEKIKKDSLACDLKIHNITYRKFKLHTIYQTRFYSTLIH